MSVDNNKRQRIPLLGAFLSVIITFSILLVFSDRISSKPSEAGFWMILIFGVSLGVAITLMMRGFSKNN